MTTNIEVPSNSHLGELNIQHRLTREGGFYYLHSRGLDNNFHFTQLFIEKEDGLTATRTLALTGGKNIWVLEPHPNDAPPRSGLIAIVA